MRPVFGKITIQSPRFLHCDCQSLEIKSFSPLAPTSRGPLGRRQLALNGQANDRCSLCRKLTAGASRFGAFPRVRNVTYNDIESGISAVCRIASRNGKGSKTRQNPVLPDLTVQSRYRFIPTSLLVRLMPGDQKNNNRHLQTLFHHGLVNRFCLPKYGGPGEFMYYLDSAQSLATLIEAGLLPGLTDEERSRRQEIIRNNREAAYDELHKNPGNQGRVLYIQHELMISRFHAMLELACKKFAGKVELRAWKQGAELWNRVQAPKVSQDGDTWIEQSTTELLPHRPDAFFTLYFPAQATEKQHVHFMYEADRGSENTSRFKMKLRAHWHFIVKQNLQRTVPCYGVHSIRAVLTESTTSQWADNLRDAARHPIVSPKPSPLFWFTTSELLTKPMPGAGNRTVPLYLEQPETILKRIWSNPVEGKFLNLAD